MPPRPRFPNEPTQSTRDVKVFALALLEARKGTPIHFEGLNGARLDWTMFDEAVETLEERLAKSQGRTTSSVRECRGQVVTRLERAAWFAGSRLYDLDNSNPAFAVVPSHYLEWFRSVRALAIAWRENVPDPATVATVARQIEQVGSELLRYMRDEPLRVPELDYALISNDPDPIPGLPLGSGPATVYDADEAIRVLRRELSNLTAEEIQRQQAVVNWQPPPVATPWISESRSRQEEPATPDEEASSEQANVPGAQPADGSNEMLLALASGGPAADSPIQAVLVEYFADGELVEDSCSPERLTGHLHQMGAPASEEITARDANAVQVDYNGFNRTYHRFEHPEGLAQPSLPAPLVAKLRAAGLTEEQIARAQANRAYALWTHDWVQMHLDASPSGTEGAIPAFADALVRPPEGPLVAVEAHGRGASRTFKVTLTKAGRDDDVTRAVAHVFGVGDDGTFHSGTLKGANEFLSALAAAKLAELKQVPPESIIDVTAIHAATVPFQPTTGVDADGRPTDGYIGQVINQLATVELTTSAGHYSGNRSDAYAMALVAVDAANHDVQDFALPRNHEALVRGAREIRAEELAEFRRAQSARITMPEFVRASRLEISATLLYGWFAFGKGLVSVNSIVKLVFERDEEGRIVGVENAYPPIEICAAAAGNARSNTEIAYEYFRAHHLGIVFAQCWATRVGRPNIVVQDLVSAADWKGHMPPGDGFDPKERAVDALLGGAGQRQANPMLPPAAPISKAMHGENGRAGTLYLWGVAQSIVAAAAAEGIREDPFAHPKFAEQFFSAARAAIGEERTRVIGQQLAAVARSRGDLDRAERTMRLLDPPGRDGREPPGGTPAPSGPSGSGGAPHGGTRRRDDQARQRALTPSPVADDHKDSRRPARRGPRAWADTAQRTIQKTVLSKVTKTPAAIPDPVPRTTPTASSSGSLPRRSGGPVAKVGGVRQDPQHGSGAPAPPEPSQLSQPRVLSSAPQTVARGPGAPRGPKPAVVSGDRQQAPAHVQPVGSGTPNPVLQVPGAPTDERTGLATNPPAPSPGTAPAAPAVVPVDKRLEVEATRSIPDRPVPPPPSISGR